MFRFLLRKDPGISGAHPRTPCTRNNVRRAGQKHCEPANPPSPWAYWTSSGALTSQADSTSEEVGHREEREGIHAEQKGEGVRAGNSRHHGERRTDGLWGQRFEGRQARGNGECERRRPGAEHGCRAQRLRQDPPGPMLPGPRRLGRPRLARGPVGGCREPVAEGIRSVGGAPPAPARGRGGPERPEEPGARTETAAPAACGLCQDDGTAHLQSRSERHSPAEAQRTVGGAVLSRTIRRVGTSVVPCVASSWRIFRRTAWTQRRPTSAKS